MVAMTKETRADTDRAAPPCVKCGATKDRPDPVTGERVRIHGLCPRCLKEAVNRDTRQQRMACSAARRAARILDRQSHDPTPEEIEARKAELYTDSVSERRRKFWSKRPVMGVSIARKWGRPA